MISKGTEAESNILLQSRVDYIRQGEDIPVKDLKLLKGELHGKPVKDLKMTVVTLIWFPDSF